MTKLSRFILLGIVSASAPVFAQMVCTTQGTIPVLIRKFAFAELLPDVVVVCTGGTPTPAGQAVPVMTISVVLDAPIFSRQLIPGMNFREALVLVDEPAPANQSPCTLVICTILGTGTGSGTYSGASGRPNVFQGRIGGNGNVLNFPMAVDPPGSGTRTFRFTNLRVNNSANGGGQPQIRACNSLVPCPNGAPVDGIVLAMVGPDSELQLQDLVATTSRINSFKLILTEGFANTFKTRTSAGPFPADQNVPGSPPLYETGFRNSAFPNTAQGDLGTAGLADSGLRFVLQLDFVPSQVSITVPTRISFGPSGLSAARLINTDINGAGPYQEATSGLRTPDGNGTILVVYEITQSSPFAIETVEMSFTVNYGAAAPATLLQFVGATGFGPLPAAGQPQLEPKFSRMQFEQGTIDAPGPLTITTAPLLPPAAVGTLYSKTIFATGGTAPYTYSSLGVLPVGLNLSANGVLSGTPLVSGTFSVAIQATDAAPASTTTVFTLPVGPGPQNSVVQLSSLQLEFVAPQGGPSPPVQTLTVQTAQQQDITITTDGGNPNLPTPSWLSVLFQATGAPYSITVAVNQGTRAAGTYNARILVGVVGSTAQPLVVNVVLTVAAADPQLSLSSESIEFTAKIVTPGPLSQTVQLSNIGGGGPITFTASILNRSSWIRAITPTQGQAGTNPPTPVRVDIDTTGLPLGFQRDTIRFTWLGKTLDLPVVVFVAPSGAQLQLSRTGVYFRSNVGSLNLQTQQVRILNLDQSSAITWTATILSGSQWLASNWLSGVSTFSDPSEISLGVKPDASNFPTGPQYALVRIDAPNTINAPQYIVGVLDIQAGTTTSGPDFDAAGAVLTAVTGSTQAVSHAFKITTGSSAPSVAFSASVSSPRGAGIFSISPASGSLNFTTSTQLRVSANPTGLAAGVYTAEIPVATAQGVRTLAVTLIVANSVGGASIAAGARAAGCVPSSLAATQIGITNNFSVPAGWPTALVVDLRDNCGTQVLNGSVVADFSNGDPPLSLTGDGFSSLYSATWQPVAQVNPMTVTIHAETPNLPQVDLPLTGGIVPNTVPMLFTSGTIHNLDPKLAGPLSPGVVAQVYGTNMASVSESTGAVPLATLYKGTQVLIGPYEAPLYYVSPGQLNVQVPTELAPNLPYAVVVSANGALTVPDTINVVPAVPGVAAFLDGRVIAQHNADFALVTEANPAKRDEFLILYLVGLGATNPPVASGVASPAAEPFGRPVFPVTITLGGQAVEVPFVGLTPFGVGLFQINMRVPANAPLNTPLDIVITQNGLSANVATLTVAP